MVDENASAKESSTEVYDLDLEEEVSTDPSEIMREAVEAVESHRHEEMPAANKSQERDEGEEGTEGRLRQLEIENAEFKEQALRALADYENFRRRSSRERAEQERYAAAAPLREFLPIIDNLERALAAAGSQDDLRAGVELIHRQMQDLLTKFNVERVPGEGERFDPAVHEAVVSEEDEEIEAPTVVEEMQPGYLLHDRLLRPAMVKVAVPVDPGGNEDPPEDEPPTPSEPE